MTKPEEAIYLAMQEVEKLPAHEKQTEAVTLLGKAKEIVAQLSKSSDFRSIKTFKDACDSLGINEDHFLSTCRHNGDTDDEKAYKQLKIVSKALNGDWKPNWADSNEYKYFPWFDMRPGFAFSNSLCVITYSITYLGSRLCYKSSEIAKYAGDQFTEIYQQFLTLNK